VRTVVNALIQRYGHPSEVIVEVARDLKQNLEQRKEDQERQARNQKRNERLRNEASGILQCAPERVRQRSGFYGSTSRSKRRCPKP